MREVLTSTAYNLSGVRFFIGDIYATEGDYFKIRFYGSQTTALGDMPAFLSSKVTFYVCEKQRDGSWFRKGTKADLIPYKLDPENSSRIFVRQYYTATQVEMVIFNEY